MKTRWSQVACALAAVGLVGASLAEATPVKQFQIRSRDAFLAGKLEGVSVDAFGRVQLAEAFARSAALDEPYVLSAAATVDGWVVGTGDAGKVLKVDRKGKVELLFTAPEPTVFALRAEPDGTVYAATSPKGKVYRIAGGRGEVYFDPGETYIWGLARAADGALLVATGTEGKLYRVSAANTGTVLYDAAQAHLRSLAVLPGGDVVIGTAEGGRVLRLGPDGQVRTLHDARQPEIVALAVGDGGVIWAAAVGSEASLLSHDFGRGTDAAPGTGEPTAEAAAGVSVSVAEDFERPAPSARGASRARSQVLRITPGGAVETAASFNEETIYALAWRGGKLWVATGLDGKLYKLEDGVSVLAATLGDRQLVALEADGADVALITTNAGALYRRQASGPRKGSFESGVHDAGSTARFGTLAAQAEVPAGASLAFSARSGLSAEPDETWSPWSAPATGLEVALAQVPAGRYLQWRAELGAPEGSKAAVRLHAVEISYRQLNVAPEIRSFTAMEPGQILVPPGFAAGTQAFEPAHPSRDGIFTTIGEAAGGDDSRQRTLWKRGFQTLRWEASDANADALSYRLELQPLVGDGAWFPMVEDWSETSFAFDTWAVPDGVYRFRLTAREAQLDAPLEATRISPPVTLDHSPPVLEGVRKTGRTLRLSLRDALSPLTTLELSIDGKAWQDAVVADGLVDGRSETLELVLPEGARMVILRAMDAAWNIATFDLVERAR